MNLNERIEELRIQLRHLAKDAGPESCAAMLEASHRERDKLREQLAQQDHAYSNAIVLLEGLNRELDSRETKLAAVAEHCRKHGLNEVLGIINKGE